MKFDVAVDLINNLIETFGKEARDDDEYLVVLGEMRDRANIAIAAYQEMIQNEGQNSKSSTREKIWIYPGRG